MGRMMCLFRTFCPALTIRGGAEICCSGACFYAGCGFRRATQGAVAGIRQEKFRLGCMAHGLASWLHENGFHSVRSLRSARMFVKTAGLRCGRLRPADVCDVEPYGMFNCKLPYYLDAACEGTRRLRSGPSRGEAAARRWLAPSPFGHAIAGSACSRAEGSAQALRRNAALRQWAAAGCRTYVRVR